MQRTLRQDGAYVEAAVGDAKIWTGQIICQCTSTALPLCDYLALRLSVATLLSTLSTSANR